MGEGGGAHRTSRECVLASVMSLGVGIVLIRAATSRSTCVFTRESVPFPVSSLGVCIVLPTGRASLQRPYPCKAPGGGSV